MIVTVRLEVPDHTVAEAVLAVVLQDVEDAGSHAIDSPNVTGWDVLGLVWAGDLPGIVLDATMTEGDLPA